MAQSKPKRKKKPSKANNFSFKKAIATNKRRLIELCKGVGCDITDRLSESHFFDIYIYTYQFGGVKCHPDHDISNDIITHYKNTIKSTLFTKHHTPLKQTDFKISFDDIDVIEGLMAYVERRIEVDEISKNILLNDIRQLEQYYGNRVEQLMMRRAILWNMQKNISVISRSFYSLHREFIGHKSNLRCSIVYFLKKHHPVKEYLKINHQSRPVYKVQIPSMYMDSSDEGFLDCMVETNMLKGAYHGTLKKMPVYIQSHALERIYQRLYPMKISILTQIMNNSLFDHIQVQYFNQRILITVDFMSLKLGYFVGEIIGEKLVIKTFLLLSNNSTPEGTIFKRLTGFSKHDVGYWDIDSFPTFINNSMEQDNHLYPYFEQSGLLHLFVFTPDLFKGISPEYQFKGELNWNKMEDYMNQTADKQELSHAEFEGIDFSQMMR